MSLAITSGAIMSVASAVGKMLMQGLMVMQGHLVMPPTGHVVNALTTSKEVRSICDNSCLCVAVLPKRAHRRRP